MKSPPSPSHLYVSLLRNRTAEGGDPFESPLSFSQQQSASLHLSTLQRRIHTLVTICRQAFSRRTQPMSFQLFVISPRQKQPDRALSLSCAPKGSTMASFDATGFTPAVHKSSNKLSSWKPQTQESIFNLPASTCRSDTKKIVFFITSTLLTY